MRIFRAISALGLFVVGLSMPAPTRAAEPTQQWFTIKTPHFYVHFYKSVRHDEQAMAQKVARVAERCHRVLAPIFKHKPTSRTHIVVTDDTDGANGSAQAIPYNIVRVYLTGPDSRSYLQDYDDWLTALIMHEYTHILHLDTIHGLPRLVNAVMGKIWAPNQLQPRWFIEGLAVYQETKRTSGGRLRSSMFDMTLRSHVLEGKFLRLDQISSNTRLYPRGHVPYLYGAFFVRYIAERYGDAALTKISHGYGGTPVPYALNKVAKRAIGKTYEQLYGDFERYLKRRYGLQKAAVLARGRSPRVKLTAHGWSVGSPRYAPGGKQLVYLASDGRSVPAIRLVDAPRIVSAAARAGQGSALVARGLRNGKLRLRAEYPHLGGHTVAFTPDGRHLVYGQGVNWRTFHAYHDLYVRRRSDKRVRRLTFGRRARDPDVSPDGSTVAYVANELGDNHLELVPFSGGKVRRLRSGKNGEQFFRPRFSPDGRWLVVSYWRPGGRRDLALVDVKSGALHLLTDDRVVDMDPVFSADGKRLYFASDRTGIFNIYCLELAWKAGRGRPPQTGALWQLTNVLGGALAPALSPDERQLVYVGFGAYGFDLHATRLDPRKRLAALPYVDTRPLARLPAPVQPLAMRGKQADYRGGKVGASAGASPAGAAAPRSGATPSRSPRRARGQGPKLYPVVRYNPLQTVYPRSWSFSLGTDQFGTALGIELAGSDVINRHRYLATTNISTTKGYVSYLAAYSYSRFWPSLNLDTARYVSARGGVVEDGARRSYIEENWGFGATVGLPVLRIPQHSVNISVGYRMNYFRDADENTTMVLPGQLTPQLPEVGLLSGVTASITYTNILRYQQSVSNESGRQLNISLRVDGSVFGSDYRSTRVSWSWAEYVDLPWLDDHVLAVRYAGGVARGDFKRRGFFFIGGFPQQNLIQAVIEQLPIGGAYLRGYPPGKFYGDQFHLLNVEYRMPLYEIERGMSSLPLYFNFVHLAAFCDVGKAFFGDLKLDELKVGVGGELLLEFVIGYFVPLTLRVGFARGLMAEGGNELFVLIGRRF
jgi:hypothetical protein